MAVTKETWKYKAGRMRKSSSQKGKKCRVKKNGETGVHRLDCLQYCQMPINNSRRTRTEVESEPCQNVNYQVSTGLCWRQGTEVGENRGNRVDKQLQTNNTTKHSIKMVLLSGQMMTNAQCTYTDLKPIMIKLSILLLWIAFLILLFWRRKTFESDHTIIARTRDT